MSLGAAIFMGSMFAALSSPIDVMPRAIVAPSAQDTNAVTERTWEPESPGPGESATVFLPLEHLEAGMTDGTAENIVLRRGAAGCPDETSRHLAATARPSEFASMASDGSGETESEKRSLDCDNLSLAVLPSAR